MIGAGSLVTKDVEPWTINVGYPARVVGKQAKPYWRVIGREAPDKPLYLVAA